MQSSSSSSHKLLFKVENFWVSCNLSKYFSTIAFAAASQLSPALLSSYNFKGLTTFFPANGPFLVNFRAKNCM